MRLLLAQRNFRHIAFLLVVVVIFLAWALVGLKNRPTVGVDYYCSHDAALAHEAVDSLRRIPPYYSIPKSLESGYPVHGDSAEQFIAMICAIYGDNPQARNARLQIISRLYRLPTAAKMHYTATDDLWRQLTVQGYIDLISLSDAIARFRRFGLNSAPGLLSNSRVLDPLPPLTRCELKFIFERYLSQGRKVERADEFKQYEHERGDYASAHCNEHDNRTTYFFRGDGGLAPALYEARTMSMSQNAQLTDHTRYLKKPLELRRQGSQAVLRALLYYPDALQNLVADPDKNIIFSSASLREEIAPFYFLKDGKQRNLEELQDIFRREKTDLFSISDFTSESEWKSSYALDPDQGFAAIFDTSTLEGRQRAWSRLSAMFNRHVQYYSTNLVSHEENAVFDRVSPWVSTAAYPHLSHKFTVAGFNRGLRSGKESRWLSIFRVDRDDLYSAADLAAGKAIDFSRMWFNEQTFSSLLVARREVAWDRFATVAPESFEALLLLDRVNLPPFEE